MLIELEPADLADCRFAISPLVEVTGVLGLFSQRGRPGVLAPWVRRARPALEALRREEPAVGALISLASRTHNADFLLPPPTGPHTRIADEIAVIRSTPLPRARAELAENLRGHPAPPAYVSRLLDGDDVVDRLADGLAAAWTTLIEPEWPRLRALLERDIVQRAGRLAAYGWSDGLAGLHPRVSWAPDGRLMIRVLPLRSSVTGSAVLLIPSIFSDLMVRAVDDDPLTIAYRARGVIDLLGEVRREPDEALARLIGGGRASVLRALAAPATTSQLAARLGLSLGGIAGHLAVLHGSGLISRTRTGRSVVYALTPRGDNLLE
jgi:DNA-binding transcriptional ArsR family regulator